MSETKPSQRYRTTFTDNRKGMLRPVGAWPHQIPTNYRTELMGSTRHDASYKESEMEVIILEYGAEYYIKELAKKDSIILELRGFL